MPVTASVNWLRRLASASRTAAEAFAFATLQGRAYIADHALYTANGEVDEHRNRRFRFAQHDIGGGGIGFHQVLVYDPLYGGWACLAEIVCAWEIREAGSSR